MCTSLSTAVTNLSIWLEDRGFKGALRLLFRRRVSDAKTKVGEREDPSNKNESPEAIESSRETTFEFRRASADDVMRD